MINSVPAKVWTTLTAPGLMTQWMGDPEMKIEVVVRVGFSPW